MSGNENVHPNGGSLEQYPDFNSFCFNFLAWQATRDANRDIGNLGTHPSRGASLPSQSILDRMEQGDHMDDEPNFSRSPTMYAEQNGEPYISMIPTIRTLECLAWQLLYGSEAIVFDESRWQECFQAFNTMAMQSTSLITILSKKYEEKQAFERIAQAMISTCQINQWTPQMLIDVHNQVQVPHVTENGMDQSKSAMPPPPNPIKAKKKPRDKVPVKKAPKKAPAKKAMENTEILNDEEPEKVDDEEMAWKLHLELNTKPRQGKPRAKQKLTRAVSLPDADIVPESHSRRKQSRKNIRRSL